MNGQVDLLVDPAGLRLSDNSSGVIGTGGIIDILFVYAGSENLRYYPGRIPGDSYNYGVSFDDVLPKGIGIVSGTIQIFTNSAVPAPVTDLTAGTLTVQDRAVYANISGGTSGTDYQLRWVVTASDGSIHSAVALLLCSIPGKGGPT